LVTYAKDGSPVLTKVGVVGGADGQPGPDAAKTLGRLRRPRSPAPRTRARARGLLTHSRSSAESLKFQIGDFVDVAIL
jgi:hypothetical protein